MPIDSESERVKAACLATFEAQELLAELHRRTGTAYTVVPAAEHYESQRKSRLYDDAARFFAPAPTVAALAPGYDADRVQ